MGLFLTAGGKQTKETFGALVYHTMVFKKYVSSIICSKWIGLWLQNCGCTIVVAEKCGCKIVVAENCGCRKLWL